MALGKMEGKFAIAEREKKSKIEKKMFGSWVSPLVGRHVVNEPKIGCHVVNELENLKSDFVRNIHLRLYSGPSGCRVPS